MPHWRAARVGMDRDLMDKTFEIDTGPDRDVGEGSYGIVLKARSKDPSLTGNISDFAVKVINKEDIDDSIDLKNIHEEIVILRALEHPNILKLCGEFEDDQELFVYSELAKGGDLQRFVDSAEEAIDEYVARIIIMKLVYALRVCNNRGIVHRDIKASNILLREQGNPKDIVLCDFGLAKRMTAGLTEHNMLHGRAGTPSYMAPEIYEKKPYNFKCDIWSLGVLTYFLVSTGEFPFDAETESGMRRAVKHGEYSFNEPTRWSDAAKDFISKLLVVDPALRYNYDQIIEHEWLQEPLELKEKLEELQERLDQKEIAKGDIHLKSAALVFKKRLDMAEKQEKTKRREKKK